VLIFKYLRIKIKYYENRLIIYYFCTMSQLVKLIEAWEVFAVTHPGGDPESFARWLLSREPSRLTGPGESGKVIPANLPEVRPEEKEMFRGDDPAFDAFPGNIKTSMQASYLLSKMNQYILFYTKPIMKQHGLHSIDDFGYLQTVQAYKNINKSKACELMMQEITTGTDIIRRLIRNGLLKEKTNKEDKREKLLQITSKGEKILGAILSDFVQLPDTLGEMPAEDRAILLQWLMQLDAHHEHIVKGR
jgi:DNA-binding MarR family transcriptional regulator